VVVSSH